MILQCLWLSLASSNASNMANECSRHPGVLALKPFCEFDRNLLASINFSRRFAITAKKILPIVFVRAMGRNSDGSVRFVDFARSCTLAAAQSVGISFVRRRYQDWQNGRAALKRHIRKTVEARSCFVSLSFHHTGDFC